MGVLVGAGSVCLGYSGQSLFLPNWFVRRRGLAIGIAFAGVGVGSIVLLPWLQTVIQGAGWRTACWAMGVLVLVVLAPINLLLRKSPQDMGLQPDGAAAPSATAAAPPSNVVDAAWAAVDWTLGRAMRTARFWWIAFGYFCGLYAWYAVQVHQTKYLIEIGFSPGGCGLGAGARQSRRHSRPDRARPRLGPDRPGMGVDRGLPGFAACYAALIALQYSQSPMLLYVMIAAQGVLGYGLTSVFAAIVAEIFQGRHYGTIFGTLMLSAIGGGALGPWATGALHDAYGNYEIAFMIGFVLSLVAVAAIWRAAPRKVRVVAGQMHRLAAVRR